MIEIYNVCRNCGHYTVVGFDGYCSKECKKMDFDTAYAAADQGSAWDHAMSGRLGERGGKTPKPRDLYEGVSDGDAWAKACRFDAWEGSDA